MLETRILENEVRSIRVANIEIRMDKNHIFICGSLPIRSLSHPITDRKTGKKFRELVEPSAFKLALMSNKAHGYKTKLLKNHLYECEFEYENGLEFDEVNERELRFLASDYSTAEKKAQKFVTKKNRESLCKKQDEKLQEMKNYINMQKKNAFYRVGSEFKIPL